MVEGVVLVEGGVVMVVAKQMQVDTIAKQKISRPGKQRMPRSIPEYFSSL